jgi:ATP-dependent Clp protease ATP-binding subunit ClpB
VWSDDAVDAVLTAAYKPEFGARPLKRHLEKHITTQVSKLIISGSVGTSGAMEDTCCESSELIRLHLCGA